MALDRKEPASMAAMQAAVDKLTDEIIDLRGDPDDPVQPLAKVGQQLNFVKVADNKKIKFRRILKGHFGKIYSMHWASNSKHLVSASQDGKLLIWNAYSTHKLHAIPLKSSWVMTCAFSRDPKSSLVACGGLDNLCTVYKMPDPNDTGHSKQKPVAELAHHEGYLSCCRFIGDQKIITSSGDSTCILWDIQKGTVERTFDDHTGDVMSVSIWENGQFVSGSCDSTAKFWDFRQKGAVQSYKQDNKDDVHVKTFPGHESDINSVQMFPDGNAFGTGSDDSACRLFDIRACRQLNRYGNDKILCGITSVDFTKSGRYLVAGYDDESCLLWDTVLGHSPSKVEGHDNRVSCLGVSYDGKALCTGSWDTYLKIWA